MRILAISGSLREGSSNTALLVAAARLADNEFEGLEIRLCDLLGSLPHFNPDLEGQEPAAVLEFRAALSQAGAVMICSPEYAHGVPGTMKNALDWVVGSGELVDKPCALISASPRSTYVHQQLLEILTTMSARVVPEASVTIPLGSNRVTVDEILANPEFSAQLRSSLSALARAPGI